MVCLGNEQRSFCRFWDTSKYCISDSLVDHDGYSISSKGFLAAVVDIMIIWVKFTHSVYLSLLIPRMSLFTLAISCLTTSNLPWFMDLTFPIYAILLFTASDLGSFFFLIFFFSDLASITSHIHKWVLFLLWLHPFILSGVISPLVSSSIFPYWPGEFPFQYPILFLLFMGFSRREYWSGLPFPFPVDHVLSELSTIAHPSWMALHGMVHSFIELDKAVVHVISLVSFLWLWFFILSALWWIRIRGLWKLPDGRNWLRGKLGLVLMGGAMFIKKI